MLALDNYIKDSIYLVSVYNISETCEAYHRPHSGALLPPYVPHWSYALLLLDMPLLLSVLLSTLSLSTLSLSLSLYSLYSLSLSLSLLSLLFETRAILCQNQIPNSNDLCEIMLSGMVLPCMHIYLTVYIFLKSMS